MAFRIVETSVKRPPEGQEPQKKITPMIPGQEYFLGRVSRGDNSYDDFTAQVDPHGEELYITTRTYYREKPMDRFVGEEKRTRKPDMPDHKQAMQTLITNTGQNRTVEYTPDATS